MCVSRYNAGHSEALQTEDVLWSLSSHRLFFLVVVIDVFFVFFTGWGVILIKPLPKIQKIVFLFIFLKNFKHLISFFS